MVVRLSRSKLAAVCRAFDGGELVSRSLFRTAAPTVFFVKNAGSSSINEGAPIAVSGFSIASLPYAKAAQQLNNGALILSGQQGGSHAIALERIAPGKIGRAASLGLCFHAVTITDASYDYANSSFQTVGTFDYYAIIAKSATYNGSAICALYHEPQGGGGTGTLTASVSSNVLTLEIV